MRRDRSGFTLIELAIVLVIIGIILGMILKGQDLIESARIKKAQEIIENGYVKAFVSAYDKSGIPPGDTDGDFIIDADPLTCTTQTCRSFQEYLPNNSHSVRIGGDIILYIYFGAIDHDGNPSTPNVNVLVVCGSRSCNRTFNSLGVTYVRIAQNLDRYLDNKNRTIDQVDDRNGDIVGATSLNDPTASSNLITSATLDTPTSDATVEWDGNEVGVVYFLRSFQ